MTKKATLLKSKCRDFPGFILVKEFTLKTTSLIKNTLKFFGIIAFVALIVFSMATCDSESGTGPTSGGGSS